MSSIAPQIPGVTYTHGTSIPPGLSGFYLGKTSSTQPHATGRPIDPAPQAPASSAATVCEWPTVSQPSFDAVPGPSASATPAAPAPPAASYPPA